MSRARWGRQTFARKLLNPMKPYALSHAPHIFQSDSLRKINWKNILALLPAVLVCFIFSPVLSAEIFGISLGVLLASEFLFLLLARRRDEFSRGGWLVNGILFALVVPVDWPLGTIAAGAALLFFLGEEAFGGFARRPFHPVLVTLLLIQISFPTVLSSQGGGNESLFQWMDLLGRKSFGRFADLSPFLLLLGGIVWTRFQKSRREIPWIYLGSVFFSLLFLGGLGWNLFYGQGLFLCAFFFVTDFSTTPTTVWGHRFFAILSGVMGALAIRFHFAGGGLFLPLLLANALSPCLDEWIKPRGVVS